MPCNSICPKFFPDLGVTESPRVENMETSRLWRVELVDSGEGEAPVRLTGKWGEWSLP